MPGLGAIPSLESRFDGPSPVASSAFFFTRSAKTFAPDQDEGRFLVYLRTPLGSSIDYTDSRLR